MPRPKDRCASRCPGWLHMDTGVQACDDCARFRTDAGASDDDAAQEAHDKECRRLTCPMTATRAIHVLTRALERIDRGSGTASWTANEHTELSRAIQALTRKGKR